MEKTFAKLSFAKVDSLYKDPNFMLNNTCSVTIIYFVYIIILCQI